MSSYNREFIVIMADTQHEMRSSNSIGNPYLKLRVSVHLSGVSMSSSISTPTPDRTEHCHSDKPGSTLNQPWSKEQARGGSEGRNPTCKTLSPKRCEVDDKAQGRKARETARLHACALAQRLTHMWRGEQDQETLPLTEDLLLKVGRLTFPLFPLFPLFKSGRAAHGNLAAYRQRTRQRCCRTLA